MKTESSGVVIKLLLVFATVLFAISISKADYCPPGQPCSTSCGGAVGWTTADGNFNQYGDFMPNPSGGNWYKLSISGKQDVEAIMYLTSNAVYDLKIYDGQDANMNLKNLCSSYGYKGETRYCFGTVNDGGFIKARYGSDWGSYYFQVNCPYIYQSSASVPTETKLGEYLDINITIGYSSWRQQDVFFVVDLIKGDSPNCEKLWCDSPSTDTECGIGNCIAGFPFPVQKIGGGTTVTTISVPLPENGTNGEYKVYVTAYHSGEQLSSSPNNVNYSNPYFTKLYAGTVNIIGGNNDIVLIFGPEENEAPVGFFPLPNLQNSVSGNSGSGTVILGASVVAVTALIGGVAYSLGKIPINGSSGKEVAKSIEKIEKLLAPSRQSSNSTQPSIEKYEGSSFVAPNDNENYTTYSIEKSTLASIISEAMKHITKNSLGGLGKAFSLVSSILNLSETYEDIYKETGNKDLATGTAVASTGAYVLLGEYGLAVEGGKLVCVGSSEAVRSYIFIHSNVADKAESVCLDTFNGLSVDTNVKKAVELPIIKELTTFAGCTINSGIGNKESSPYFKPLAYDVFDCAVTALPKVETKTMKEPKIVTMLNNALTMALEGMRPAGEFLADTLGLTNNSQASTSSNSSSSSSGSSSSSSGGSSGSSGSSSGSNSSKTVTPLTALSAVISKSSSQTNTIKQSATTAVTNFTNTVSTAISKVANTATTVFNNAATTANNVFNTITTSAKTTVTAVTNTASTTFNNVTKTVSSALTSASNAISNLFSGGSSKTSSSTNSSNSSSSSKGSSSSSSGKKK